LGKSCWIQDGLFQEIDLETGNLLFEWRATDHISMKDVYSSPSRKDGHGKSKKDAFDFFHINSVDKTDSGDYLISARYMHAVVCISSKTGDILWQLGGKHNNFEDLNGATNFAWQHHVTWQGNNTISIFDNHANNVFHSPSKHSKGMLIRLDMEKLTATLLQAFVHPDKILNVSQGSVQVVPETGNVLVGFGNSPTYVEYSAEGKVLCSAHFAPHLLFEIIDFGFVKSYRVFKKPWVGRPKTTPDVKVKRGKVYVSWNGATEVRGWRLETAKAVEAKDHEFVTIQELKRDGFETSFTLDKNRRYVRIAALDATNAVMAYSATVKTPSPSVSSSSLPPLTVPMLTLPSSRSGQSSSWYSAAWSWDWASWACSSCMGNSPSYRVLRSCLASERAWVPPWRAVGSIIRKQSLCYWTREIRERAMCFWGGFYVLLPNFNDSTLILSIMPRRPFGRFALDDRHSIRALFTSTEVEVREGSIPLGRWKGSRDRVTEFPSTFLIDAVNLPLHQSSHRLVLEGADSREDYTDFEAQVSGEGRHIKDAETNELGK
jgi:hypothetical protein